MTHDDECRIGEVTFYVMRPTARCTGNKKEREIGG